MTIDEAKEIVHDKYPGAFHMGHGTANQIVERHATDEERRSNNYPKLKRLSQMFCIFSYWPLEIQKQMDTAMWVQAAMTVKDEIEKGWDNSRYF